MNSDWIKTNSDDYYLYVIILTNKKYSINIIKIVLTNHYQMKVNKFTKRYKNSIC